MSNSPSGSAGPAVTDLQKGLSNKSASASDASTKCSGGSVNSDPVRSGVASSGSLGGRCA